MDRPWTFDPSGLRMRNYIYGGIVFLLSMALGYWGFGEYQQRRCEKAGGTWVEKGKSCRQ